jgi:hypothetical protein
MIRMEKQRVLTSDQYDSMKKKALNYESLKIQMPLNELEYAGDDSVRFEGKLVSMSRRAVEDYLEICKIPKSFIARIDKKISKDSSEGLVNAISSVLGQDGQNVYVVFNEKENSITRILPTQKKYVSNAEMLQHAEDTINSFNLDVVQFNVSNYGDVSLSTVSPRGFTEIADLGDDEKFQCGVAFNNKIDRGYEMHPFMERLSCANGIEFRKVHGFKDTMALHDLNENVRKNFNQKMIELQHINFCPETIYEKISTAAETKASVAEMQKAVNKIMTNSKAKWEDVQRHIPIQHVINEFDKKGFDISKMTEKRKENARTNLTVWELTNALTYFASHDTGIEMNDYNRNDLQVFAGELLLKKVYDSENTIDQVF